MNFRKIQKNIRNFRKNVKAISPIISVLLMIAIAVVAALVTYAWVMGYMGFTTTKVGKAIQIQSMSATNTGVLTVYVQNVGQSPVSFSSPCIYVNGTSVDTGLSFLNIAPGTTQPLTSNVATGIVSGQTDTIKVVSTDGTFSQVTQTFP
jgi:flagellin-like protein